MQCYFLWFNTTGGTGDVYISWRGFIWCLNLELDRPRSFPLATNQRTWWGFLTFSPIRSLQDVDVLNFDVLNFVDGHDARIYSS
jgi:hypothetical protein